MPQLPDYEKRIVDEGTYDFRVKEEPSVRKSSFKRRDGSSGESKYVRIVFAIRPSGRDDVREFQYTESLFVSEPRYRDFLKAIGCREDSDGHLHTPDTFDIIGSRFTADIKHERDKHDTSIIRTRIANIRVPQADDDDGDVPPPSEEDIETPF